MHSRMHFVQLELNCFPFAGLFCEYFKLVCDYFKAKHRQTMKLGLKTYKTILLTLQNIYNLKIKWLPTCAK